jgi:hypothetical protein
MVLLTNVHQGISEEKIAFLGAKYPYFGLRETAFILAAKYMGKKH